MGTTTLFSFGDSWTEGVGTLDKEKIKILTEEEKTEFYNQHSWGKKLANLLEMPYYNYGVSGASNKMIFEGVLNMIKNKTIKENDFVAIMWSSSLRDDPPFFSNGEWKFLGNNHKKKEHVLKYIFQKSTQQYSNYDRIIKEYKEYFLENLYSDTYYHIVNQNYILHLQFVFIKLKINFVFCDAFDLMVNEQISEEINKTFLINKNNYWGFKEKTLKDYLTSFNDKRLWEDNILWDHNTIAKHPSSDGYNLIGQELYNFISENKLIIKHDIIDVNLI
jgi:lysophospholipase L1-like esterase